MRVTLFSLCVLITTVTYAQDNLVFRNGSDLSVKVLEVSSSQLKYRRQDNPEGPIYTIDVANVLLVKYANGTKDVFGPPSKGLITPAPSANVSDLATLPTLAKLRYHSGLFSRYFVDENGEPLSRTEARTLLANHPDALLLYRHGQSLRRWALATAIPAVALVGVGAGLALFGDGRHGFHGQAVGVLPGTTTPLDNDHNRHTGLWNGRTDIGLAIAGGGALIGIAAIILDHKASHQFRRAASQYNQHQQAVGLQFGLSSKSLGLGMTLTF